MREFYLRVSVEGVFKILSARLEQFPAGISRRVCEFGANLQHANEGCECSRTVLTGLNFINSCSAARLFKFTPHSTGPTHAGEFTQPEGRYSFLSRNGAAQLCKSAGQVKYLRIECLEIAALVPEVALILVAASKILLLIIEQRQRSTTTC